MNDISKTNIKTKLESAMEKEGLKPTETARIFGIHPNYISMIKNPATWVKCPAKAWDEVLKWVNSGQGLTEYSEKHGHVLPEKHEPKPGTVISKVIKTNPVKEEKREVKQESKKASRGELIDMLIEEKTLLKSKVDAIDLLLTHYIS